MKEKVIIITLLSFLNFGWGQYNFRQSTAGMVDGSQNNALFIPGASHPSISLIDIDNDDDLDIFIGNMGPYLHFIENTGNKYQPYWTFRSALYGGITYPEWSYPSLNGGRLSPFFVDFDYDGDIDVFTTAGETSKYKIRYYENIKGAFISKTDSILPVSYFDQRNYIALVDIDNDRDYDLFSSGSDNSLFFYRNHGDSLYPNFIEETDNYLNRTFNFRVVPRFKDIDSDGDFDLFLGKPDGTLTYYENIGDATNADFQLRSDVFKNIHSFIGNSFGFDLGDFDGDNDLDLIAAGSPNQESKYALSYFENTGDSVNADFEFKQDMFPFWDFEDYPAFDFVDIDGDGDNDLFVVPLFHDIIYIKNIGNEMRPNWHIETYDFQDINHSGFNRYLNFEDIDNDQDYDLLLWGEHRLFLYYNNGSKSFPVLEKNPVQVLDLDIELGLQYPYSAHYPRASFKDMDRDGDIDIIVSYELLNFDPYNFGSVGRIAYFQNTGSSTSYNFVLVDDNVFNQDFYEPVGLDLADVDGDGDFDLFISNQKTTYDTDNDGEPDSVATYTPHAIKYYENQGSAHAFNFVFTDSSVVTDSFTVAPPFTPKFVDIDADGDYDLFMGSSLGGILFYENLFLSPIEDHVNWIKEKDFELIQVYPNPFNSSTNFRITLPKPALIDVEIFNINGKKIMEEKIDLPAGQHNYSYSMKPGLSTGLYFFRFSADKTRQTQKVLYLK